MSGFLFAPLKLVSVSACQRHHSGSTKDVVSNNASKAFSPGNPVRPRPEGAKSS
jgi:hypothetical protein